MATIHDPWPKRSMPNGHPADGMTLQVVVGDDVAHTIVDPRSFEDGGLAWTLTYGDPSSVAHVAAGAIESFDYLLCGRITTTEAIRRLRILRKTRAEAVRLATSHPEPSR